MNIYPREWLTGRIPPAAAAIRTRAALWPTHFGILALALVAPCFLASLEVVSAQAPFEEVFDTGDLASSASNGGASWGDYDDDGDLDLFVAFLGTARNCLYRNESNGTFSLMESAQIGDLGSSYEYAAIGIWADMDNDGDLDLYLVDLGDANIGGTAPVGINVLYLNDGTGSFERRSPSAFVTPPRSSAGASLFDYDGDGLLDVLVATTSSPGDGVDALYRNDGGLDFSLAYEFPKSFAMAALWSDLDTDGDYDMILGDLSSNRPSYIYLNQQIEAGMTEFLQTASLPDGTQLPNEIVGGDWGDFDNDGDLDLLVGHTSMAGCDLFLNKGNGSYEKIGIPLNGNPRSGPVTWVDIDNDGRLDILVTTYNPAKGSLALGYAYLRNLGARSFEEQAVLDGVPMDVNWYPATVGDFDNDGAMDFFVVVDGASSGSDSDRLWRNTGNDNHWLKLVLKGTQSNGSGVGAVIRVKTVIDGAETWQMRQIFAGGKFLEQPDPRPNFGLGDAIVADIVEVEWPSGTVQELTDVAADQILTVVEPPRLRVESGGQLSWPVTADGYRLESAGTVDGSWTEASATVETDGSRKRVTIQPDAGTKFYRLNGQ